MPARAWKPNGQRLELIFKMTKVLADALAPIFAGLLLGYFADLWRKMDNKNVQNLITFVMSFAVPSSMFLAIASTPLSALRQQASAAVVLTIVYVVVYAISFLWVHSRQNLRPSDSSVVALTLGFPNSAAVGLPLLASVFGPQATVTVATSVAVGAITISPVTLAFLEAGRLGSGNGFALRNFTLPFIHSIKRPIVWAPLLGLVFSCLGVHLPSFLQRSVDGFGIRRIGFGSYWPGGVRSEV